MGFLIGLLTFLLVLDCVLLILLVLIQLPKKDAGAGLAFGSGATDALFGAGSGNVLTKVTKYATAIFFVMAFVLAVIQRNRSTASTTEFERQLSQKASPVGTAPAAPGGPATPAPHTVPPGATAAVANPSTNLLSTPSTPATPAITNTPAQ